MDICFWVYNFTIATKNKKHPFIQDAKKLGRNIELK